MQMLGSRCDEVRRLESRRRRSIALDIGRIAARRSPSGPGLDLVAGIEESGQGDVGLAIGIVEPEEDIGGARGPAGEEPLGPEDQPGIAVVGMDLDVGFQAGDLAGELGGLAVDRLDVGCGFDPAGLGGLGIAEPVGRRGVIAPGRARSGRAGAWGGQIAATPLAC